MIDNKSYLNLILFTCLSLSACSGDDGSDGANGSDGNNGVDGLDTLVSQQNLSAGHEQCFSGGIAIHSGLDVNSNSILDDSEITESSYIC